MKKVLSMMICVLILVSAFCVVPAFAFSEENIEITTNISKIAVSVKSPTNGIMTAQLVNTANNILYGMDEESVPTEENGEYVYTFNFKMQYNVPTDTYKVVISGNVAKTEKEFSYVSINDKISFYTNLDTKVDGEIKQYFANNSQYVPVDLTAYNDLSPTVLSLVNDKIEALSLTPDVLPTDTDEEKYSKVNAKDELFQSSFALFMDVAEIADADDVKLKETIENGTFSDYFYDEENMGSAALTTLEVLTFYKTEIEKVTELELANCVKAFNDATILAIERTKDYTTLKKAFLYYLQNSLLIPVPDMTNINTLVSSGNDTEFWKELLRADNTNVATLVANAESLAQSNINNEPQTPTSPGVGLGGGGGAGGGSGSIDKPTTPGASTGIIDNQEKTENVKTFSDLSSAEWAKEAVENLTAQGVINGRTETEFAPNDSMTREEFIKMLIGAFDLLDSESKCEFSDVSSDRWSYRYIASANRIGLVTGDGANFNPTATISRQDMAVIIYRLFELAGVEISGKVIDFDDENSISSYAKEAVDALSGAGIINGMGDGTFSPKTFVTRAQAAKVIYELQKNIGGTK